MLNGLIHTILSLISRTRLYSSWSKTCDFCKSNPTYFDSPFISHILVHNLPLLLPTQTYSHLSWYRSTCIWTVLWTSVELQVGRKCKYYDSALGSCYCASWAKCEEREKHQQDATIRCLLSTSASTCFGHHYAHLQEIKDRVLLCWFCWMWLVAVVGRCVLGCEHCWSTNFCTPGFISPGIWRRVPTLRRKILSSYLRVSKFEKKTCRLLKKKSWRFFGRSVTDYPATQRCFTQKRRSLQPRGLTKRVASCHFYCCLQDKFITLRPLPYEFLSAKTSH